MKTYTLDEIREIVSKLAAQYGAKRVYLFGSYARGDMTDSSDIDLRIDKGSIKGFQLAGLLLDLEDSLGRSVDLVPTTSLDQRFWIPSGMMRCCCMKPLDRNISVLEHIVSYCQQIEQTVERFGNSTETFQNDPIYRNAAALCILQIGELVGKLTDEFRAQHPAVPWRQIKAMRNIVAHSYGTVDPETTWEIITDDIPALKKYCETIIASQQ